MYSGVAFSKTILAGTKNCINLKEFTLDITGSKDIGI